MSTSGEATTSYVPTKWFKPEPVAPKDEAVLKLYNTLTHSKVEFVPVEHGKIKWYSCGPTVYNSSHMGHARNYVSIDINRRIIQDYFNYDIEFIQNVTDIDDKIILKARQEYLFEQFCASFDGTIDEGLIKDAVTALDEFIAKNLPEFEGKGIHEFVSWSANLDLKEIGLIKPKFPMYVKSVNKAIESIKNASTQDFATFMDNVKDVVVLKLDRELGATVTDPSIFRKCSSFWERQFDLDMKKLNVLSPTIVTRVSEYIPEIIAYVEQIINKGYAYSTSDGSVYFNTSKFDNNENHQYAKCQPWSKGDMALLVDGEGSLTSKASIDAKLNSSDFALWKSSKAGEPFWESPWGKGRPGWHIECSVMGSDFVGGKMDIHSGGIDLAFPHHDNEMAQSEAHFDCDQWVNYFLHTGHLHIEGQKMSKSLKNFITIDEALEKYSSRQLRLIFALVQWNNPLDFKQSLLNESKSIESSFDKFFSRVRALKRDNEEKLDKGEIIDKKFEEIEKKLYGDFKRGKDNIHALLCDNLSTPNAIRGMMELINYCNIYLAERNGNEVRIDLIVEIVKYLSKMLRVFGFKVREDSMGWEEVEIEKSSGGNKEEIALPFVKVLSEFRDVVRDVVIEGKDQGELMKKCDLIRDVELLELGVALDDRKDGNGALIKFLNEKERAELIKQQREKEEMIELKRRKKEELQKANAEKERLRLEKGKVSPFEMFKVGEMAAKYNEWDEEGLPLKTVDGEEVTKSARKKLVKLQAAQKKLHEEYLKSLDQ